VRAAEDYVAAADRAAEFGAQCREIEAELREEASSACLAIDMFLETQPAGAALPDGRAVQRVTKTSLRVVNEERLRAAFSSVDTAGFDSLADAVLDSLRRECTTVKQSVALRQAQGPALPPAPAAVERLCQQLDAAERGLSEVRRHKRTGSKQTKATMAPLHAAVAEAFAEAAGQPLPPAKRPKLGTETPPELPTVVITEPPSVTLPGASEATPLPPLPEAAAPAAAERAQLTSGSDTVEGEIRVRVKTRDTKGRAPSYKQFAPRLRRLLQDRTELTAQLEQQAVDLLCNLRAASAETKSSLKIERKEPR